MKLSPEELARVERERRSLAELLAVGKIALEQWMRLRELNAVIAGHELAVGKIHPLSGRKPR